MEPHFSSRPTPNDLENAAPYTLLPDNPNAASTPPQHRRSLAGIIFGLILVVSLIALVLNQQPKVLHELSEHNISPVKVLSPASLRGVSEKSFWGLSTGGPLFPWSNAMLAWQRTAFHFQPEKNWMNDPNGPLFYKGWYHFFYQYNPESAVWGNIAWGHAVSKDLVNWFHLPFAMLPDNWYDINGVWTGSATILPDGQIIMLYTGDTDDFVQVQNLAYPANLSDPLLLDWVKYPGNPILVPPPGIDKKDFRDPTTAWKSGDDTWRIAIGSKVNKTGITLVYETTNFTSFKLLDGVMHAVPGTGMWECVDFFPISTTDVNGLDTSFSGPGIKHVLKASMDDDRNDYYAIGLYDPVTGVWTPDNPELDVGIGLRYDYGKYYAAKSFYDQNKNRRVLWGWIGESDTEKNDVLKGWASLQGIPRTIVFDKKTGTNLLQWPVEEVEKLRSESKAFEGVELGPGSVVPLHVKEATQLDICAKFEVDKEALEMVNETDAGYNCSTSGAALRGALGPFGILVIADDKLSEFTPIYFYISKGADGSLTTSFCADQLRSSKASDVDKQVYGSTVPVLEGEKLSMRILVDHSIVESFAQGGRTVITSRVYPTHAIDGSARVFLFNNATKANVKASVKLWKMNPAKIEDFPSDHL